MQRFRTFVALARTTLTHPATEYVELDGSDTPLASVFVRWFDGVSSATITLWSTNLRNPNAPGSDPSAATDSADAEDWFEETTVTVAGPTASGAGCTMVHLGNLGSRRLRLRIVTAATTDIEVLVHTK